MDHFFLNHKKILVSQKKEWTEILIDLETKNNYVVIDENHNTIGTVHEMNAGFISLVKRWIFRSHRALDINLIDHNGETILSMHRPFFFIWSDLFVYDGHKKLLGSVHRKFSLIHKVYELMHANKRQFALIKSPFWRLWTFPIFSLRGQNIGEVSKKWQGIFKEGFTDADSFAVDFGSVSDENFEKAIVFATAITIDFDYFENNSGRKGIFNSF